MVTLCLPPLFQIRLPSTAAAAAAAAAALLPGPSIRTSIHIFFVEEGEGVKRDVPYLPELRGKPAGAQRHFGGMPGRCHRTKLANCVPSMNYMHIGPGCPMGDVYLCPTDFGQGPKSDQTL